MSIYRYLLLTVLACGFSSVLVAQDVHYSLFHFAPLTLNPAQTGAYEGTARVGGIYRSQWSTFRTPSFFIDAPIIRGFRKYDWVGVGMAVVNDRAGIGQLTTQSTQFSGSYHLAFDAKRRTVITLGLQGGTVTRNFNQADSLRFGDELPSSVGGGGLGQGKSADRGSLGAKTTYRDFALGLMLRTQLANQDKLETGITIGHLTQPRYGFSQDSLSNSGKARRPMRFTLHGRWDHPLNDKFSISPSALVQLTEGGREIVLQAWGGLNLKKDLKLYAGPGYRLGDAAMVLLGLDYADLRIGAAYDLNLSALSANSQRRGGFEIAANYILKIYKKPNLPPAILCPRL